MKQDNEMPKDEVAKKREKLKGNAHLFNDEVKNLWNETEAKWHDYVDNKRYLITSRREAKDQINVKINLLKDELHEHYRTIASFL